MTKEIEWDKVDNMFIAGCNITQTCAAIGISTDCLYARCLKEKNTTLSAYSQEKRSKGDALLHAAQYQKAYKDQNPTMLIWLGKQRLNQKENDDMSKIVSPKQDEIDLKHDNMLLADENRKLKEFNADKC